MVEPSASEAIRHAAWRRRIEDPRSPRGWILWGDRHLPHRQKKALGQILLFAATAIILAGFISGIGAALIGLITTWLFVALWARPGAREHASLTENGEEGAFPVTLTVWQNGRRVGKENGWVVFADGWLVYEGLRTNFSVRASDGYAKLPQSNQINLWFPKKGVCQMKLLNDYLQTNRPAKLGAGNELVRAYAQWQRAPVPDGTPIYPPLETSPRFLGERVAEFFVGSIASFSLAILFTVASFYTGAFLAVIAGSACLFYSSRNLRSLRRKLSPVSTTEEESLQLVKSRSPY